MPRRKFAPWRRQFLLGALILLAGVATLWACAASVKPFKATWALAGAAQLAVAAAVMKAAWMRRRGQRIEQSSIRSVELPAGWTGQSNRRSPAGGDVDLYLEGPGGQRFAVEIKSFESLGVRRGFLGLGRQRLTDARGRELRRDPMAQAMRNAQALHARPVLWLPKARGRTVVLGNGVIVVPGPAGQLLGAIGAKRRWWAWWWFL